MIGFGHRKAISATTKSPPNHIHGDIAAAARPPSSGVTGARLKRFRKNPTNASARKKSLSSPAPIAQQIAAPMVPRTGPARPTRASASALPSRIRPHTTAPMNGMKTGALAGMPSRRSWITCPISWTNSRITKPTANFQPQIRL